MYDLSQSTRELEKLSRLRGRTQHLGTKRRGAHERRRGVVLWLHGTAIAADHPCAIAVCKACQYGSRPLGCGDFFLQFRKMLEHVAFSSLVSNKDAYSKARAQFATDWHAQRMLAHLEKVNSDFYPLPVTLASTTIEADGKRHQHFEPVTSGFLTKADFVELYNYCGDVLHAQNPYQTRTTINVRLSVQEWLARIETLVKLHRVQLITGGVWLCTVPDKDGKVHTYTAEPT
jgi:hypothetical protein